MGLPINDRFQRPVKAGRFLSIWRLQDRLFGGCAPSGTLMERGFQPRL
jgi:hypothetical protein